MRSSSALVLCTLGCLAARGQMTCSPGTSLVIDPGTSLRITALLTWSLPAGSSVVNDGLIELGPQTQLAEAEGAAITGSGTERTARNYTGPVSNEDPGGLGARITTAATLGQTLIERGHLPFTDYSGQTSIARWIAIGPANNSGLNAALGFRYDPDELNGAIETDQRLHVRSQGDIWLTLGGAVNTTDRTVTATALDSLGLFTTFDTDLPNGLFADGAQQDFGLLGPSSGHYWLLVPEGPQVEQLELIDGAGRIIWSRSPGWRQGLHPLGEGELKPGRYLLRVNRHHTLNFVWP